MSLSLPVPRLPNLPALPEPEALDALLPGAGDTARVALAAISETVAAIAVLEAGRPGGADWVHAREQDRAAVLAGGKGPVKLAALIAGDAKRYAVALAYCTTVADRGRPAIPAGLTEAADAAAADLLGPIEAAVVAFSKAASGGRKRDAYAARDLASEVMTALAEIQAVARWSRGDDFALGNPALPEVLVTAWLDACDAIDGVPPEQGWRSREAAQSARAQWLGAVTRESNYTSRRDELAAAAGPVT